MCGIAGILNNNQPVNPHELDKLTDALSHRGPDARGTYIDKNLGLGHRRLAILDLSESGRCPMAYGGINGKRYWITFNGEIYNFLELRDELKKNGFQFKTDTDTEVVVASYMNWGESCLLRFNGMWAFAIWDSIEKQLFLARDRFGVKPLYYLSTERFVFASEIKAFLALNEFTPSLDEQIVPIVMQQTQPYEGMTDQTMMRGVRRLLGGCSLTINNRGVARLKKWWETMDYIPEIPDKYEEQVEQFREILFDAVRIRMRSDVPVGTCLSGGIDSSSISCSMSWLHRHKNENNMRRCNPNWQQSFIASFPGSQLDEREYADEVVRHIGATPHYWIFDSNEALKYNIDSVWAMEDIYNGVAVPAWCTYRELRKKNVVVSLDGHGGDELLCGYTWYLNWPLHQVNNNLYRDFHFSLLPAILRNYDRCSMAHGIEIRMPLMDWRLVTFSFGLPASSKIGGGYTKRILRDAVADIIPEKIYRRQSKIGFNSPMIEWYNGGMIPLIRNIVNHKLWIESPFWDGPALKTYILNKSESKKWTYNDWGTTLKVWTMINIVLWQLLFIEQNIESLQLEM